MKRPITDWERIFASHPSSRGLVFGIKCSENKIGKQTIPLNIGKRHEEAFHIQMGEKM